MKVFNWVWLSSLPPQERTFSVARVVTNNITLPNAVPAVILYPSLMTPCVHRADERYPWIELLLASNASLLPTHVNLQLKVYEGLSADKKFHPEALFAGLYDNIEVDESPPTGQGLVRTHERFAGVLHELVLDRLKKAGLDKIYAVRVHQDALLNYDTARRSVRPEDEHGLDWRAERQDELIKEMLETRHTVAGYRELPEKGRFAFRNSDDGVKLWDTKADASKGVPEETAHDTREPIQAYHPVYVLQPDQDAEYLNFGHLTDIHINSRVDLLAQSPVQVIPGKGSDGNALSPEVGSIVQPTNRSFKQLLTAMHSESDAHALLIGGDLIDHQLNAYTTQPPDPTMEAVWKAVDVSVSRQKDGYAAGVDMVAFCSMMLDFCRSENKPVFAVSGNHDCYFKPFGISPRAFGLTRANEGIPADLNLTFYEAALVFGPSWADCEVSLAIGGKPHSSFVAEWMEWFYSVFTPFTDFSIQLPKQQLVCLGWGGDETMLLGGQGIGHLPRASESVSPVQLSLVKEAVQHHTERRVVLLTHFTVASFEDEIPLLNGGKPSHGFVSDVALDDYVMGTFEDRRAEFLRLLGERTITCVLSGHSHRRGLYLVGKLQTGSLGKGGTRNSLPVTIHDPEHFDLTKSPASERVPALIVSDSGGPYPRHNRYGEFGGWGSDMPSGSIAVFDSAGALSQVKVVRASEAKPRLAVAVDYYEVLHGSAWSLALATNLFSLRDEARMMSTKLGDHDTFYELDVSLHPHLDEVGLRVRTVSLYRTDPKGTISLTLSADARAKCKLLGWQNHWFHNWAQQTPSASWFVSVVFDWTKNHSDLAPRYDCSEAWNFEVEVESRADAAAFSGEPGMTVTSYSLRRPMRVANGIRAYPEVPDFAWRKHKYGVPEEARSRHPEP